MSAVRAFREGRWIWLPVDDGCSPHRGTKGIRGAAFDNPVMVERVIGESDRARLNRQTREYKAREAAK